MALDNTTEVETPERIRFRYRTAGPVRRSLAYLVDLLVRLGLLLAFFILISLAASVSTRDLRASQGITLLVVFVLEWGYFVLFETLWNGMSPGKRALGLRVVNEGGFPVSFVDSVLRNLLRAADFLPVGYVVGLVAMAGDRRFRRLGDRVAGTMVVIEERVRVADPIALVPPPAPGEREALPPRPRLSADELEAIEMFLRRADLSPPRRQELAEMVAPLLARRMGVTAPTDAGRFLALLYDRAAGAQAPRRAAP